MATKIAPFTLTTAEYCVKCGNNMPIGTPVTWLRSPIEKGYYHPICEDLETRKELCRIRMATKDAPLGYVWLRANSTPEQIKAEAMRLSGIVPQIPQMKPAEVNAPELSYMEQILIDAFRKEFKDKLRPRIEINVYVAKAGMEAEAMDTLSKELFLLENTKSI